MNALECGHADESAYNEGYPDKHLAIGDELSHERLGVDAQQPLKKMPIPIQRCCRLPRAGESHRLFPESPNRRASLHPAGVCDLVQCTFSPLTLTNRYYSSYFLRST